MNDNVNHPKHYAGTKGIEVIDVMENFIPPLDGMKAICMGNIVKYVLRHHHKNGVEDLMKARWYLDRLISYYDESEKEDTIDHVIEVDIFTIISTDENYIQDIHDTFINLPTNRLQWDYLIDLMAEQQLIPKYKYVEVKELRLHICKSYLQESTMLVFKAILEDGVNAR